MNRTGGHKQPVLLVVDDDPASLHAIGHELEERWRHMRHGYPQRPRLKLVAAMVGTKGPVVKPAGDHWHADQASTGVGVWG